MHYLLKCGMADREQENVTAEFLHVQVCNSKKSHPQTSVMKPKNVLHPIITSLTVRRQSYYFHNVAAYCPRDKFRETCEQSVQVHTQIAENDRNLRPCGY